MRSRKPGEFVVCLICDGQIAFRGRVIHPLNLIGTCDHCGQFVYKAHGWLHVMSSKEGWLRRLLGLIFRT